MKRALAGALLIACAFRAKAQSDEASGDSVTIVATGDVLLHIKVNAAAARHGYGRLFSALRPHLSSDAIAFANLETPLVSDVREVMTGSPPTLGSEPEAASALADAGFDVLSMANNHAYDQGSAGALRTLQAVHHASMVAVGASETGGDPWMPRLGERAGTRGAFIATTAGLKQGP
ncbi:MAG: CapA family protein, partial [Myxococcota bacterium]